MRVRASARRRLAARVGTLAAAALAAFAVACSDSSTAPEQQKTGDVTITLTPADAQVAVGTTTTLTVTVTDANGVEVRNPQIFWSSEDTALAVVSPTGVVLAKQPGAVHIAANVSGHAGLAKLTIVPKPVATVTVTPATARLVVGSSTNLAVALVDANGEPLTDRAVTWTTSDANVASVDANGRVTALAPGAAVVTAASEGRSGASAITVVPVAVGSVSIAPSSAAIVVGQSTQLSASVTDANGAPLRDRFVAWSSSDDQIATVSSAGLVVARAVGGVTITATVEGKSATASVAVAPVPVSTITVSPSSVHLTVGEQATLTTIITDASGNVLSGRPVTFSSDAPGVATVSGAGVVRGVAPGTTTIRAESEGKTGAVTVTVVPVPVASVSVTPPSATLVDGSTTTLTAMVRDAAGNVLSNRSVAWASSNGSVATVSGSGVVTAVSPGTAIITATSEGKSDQAAITVTPVPVASVTIAPTTASITSGETVQLRATVKDASGNVLTDRTVTWSTSDAFTAFVSGSGLVTGVNPGSATITASVEGRQATATIVVQAIPVASVTVAPSAPSLAVGGTVTLTATVKDASGNTLSGRSVAWTSSNVGVATVSSSGVVTAVAPGTATIRATSEGKFDEATVTVAAPEPEAVASVSVTPSTPTATVGQTVQLTATPRSASGEALTGRTVSWTTSDAKVATVSTSGLVTTVGAGTATITATSEGKSGTATVTVQPAAVASVSISPTSAKVKRTKMLLFSAACLDATGKPLSGRTITFTTSNSKIAKINSFTSTTATVQGIGEGSATITATCEGKSASASIQVTD